jgi:hypothetical protein
LASSKPFCSFREYLCDTASTVSRSGGCGVAEFISSSDFQISLIFDKAGSSSVIKILMKASLVFL